MLGSQTARVSPDEICIAIHSRAVECCGTAGLHLTYPPHKGYNTSTGESHTQGWAPHTARCNGSSDTKRKIHYVCLPYGSPRALLLLPWLKELQGTSLAMTQGKTLPVTAHIPMFRVPPVLRRVLSRVLPAVENERIFVLARAPSRKRAIAMR